MSSAASQEPNRLDRRKARTRAALIRAAQTLIAEGRTNVPILEITQAADVGLGSFYNHFETKEQLFEAAVEAVMDGVALTGEQVWWQASTVGLAQRASAPMISPSDMMANIGHVLPAERWDAH